MNTPARRIPIPESGDINEVLFDMRPGDYCGPIDGYTGGKPAVFFIPPGESSSEEESGRPGGIHHVVSPPHVFRECNDGSLEIRESILCHPSEWHGYLDEGNIWRQV